MSHHRLERAYSVSPVIAQNGACVLAGARNHLRRFNREFRHFLAEGEQRLTWPEDQLLAYRDTLLVAHARHAVETVPYYRALALRLAFTANDLQSVADVRAHFPVLEKSEVQSLGNQLRSEAAPPGKCAVIQTSGTTGAGLRLLVPYASTRQQWAIWWRHWRSHGVARRTRCGWFAGRTIVPLEVTRPPFWRHNIAARQILYSGYHMAPGYLDAYVDHICRSNLRWLHGYPSHLALLAAHILASGRPLSGPVSTVTVAAENVTEHQRRLITEAFGVQPRQHYGSAEAVANASECSRGTLHIDEDFAYVETVAHRTTAASVLVGTNFTNPAFPLIRYQMGDVGTITSCSCDCGRSGRTLKSLDGRLEDSVLLPSGAYVGRLDHIFKGMTRVREAQIHQTVDHNIIINVVRGPDYTDLDERELLAAATQRLGPDVAISISYTTRLARSKTGKLRMVVSEVATGTAALVPEPERVG
jgi:phenylacetate-coenzyme A ligase PaaK-like adenylate-forming protein